ncbi:MAG: Hsp33 family molecular chaperone HslO, partial [Streptococcus sp.]|nr:Hsp33 family molecular chaperone HslO [Streptococcus sp.]
MVLKFFLIPKNKRRPALVFLFYAKIEAMDKIIKTISESGSFRAFVLDSTETVRAAQEYHQTQASSTVALGRTLIASQILAANEKGNTKITVKILGTSSLGAIITVADTQGNVKGYVQNPGVDIK